MSKKKKKRKREYVFCAKSVREVRRIYWQKMAKWVLKKNVWVKKKKHEGGWFVFCASGEKSGKKRLKKKGELYIKKNVS